MKKQKKFYNRKPYRRKSGGSKFMLRGSKPKAPEIDRKDLLSKLLGFALLKRRIK